MNLISSVRVTLTTATSLIFILIIISGSANFFLKTSFIYDYNINTYSIEERTGLTSNKIKEINMEVKNYSFSNDELLDVDIYSQKEILHMKDVKFVIISIINIAQILIIIFCATSLYLVVYHKTHLDKIVLHSLFWFISLLIILGASFILFFEQVFLIFHKIVFRNDLWMLNPNQDYLLMMYPEDFFRDVAILILASSFLLNVIVYFLLRFLNFQSR